MWSRHYPSISLRSNSTVLRGNKVKGIYEYNPLHGLTLSSYDINIDNVKKYIQLIERYKTPIFQAYPSAIYLMAKIMKDNGLTINHIFESIMLGSEPLYDFQKQLIQEVFNSKLCFWYGATEKVVLAGNCENDDHFHIYPQYGITELIDKHGNPMQQEGQTGEIIGTSFWNYATPFIRYKTMDYGELGQKYCEHCGRSYQLFNKIEGRLQDYIVDNEGNLVTLTALIFGQHFNAFNKIVRMKLYQDKIGDVIVKIVSSIGFAKEDQLEIVDKMQTATSNKISVFIELVENVDLTERGKLRFLDQRLNIRDFM
jgi:phenylacetate-CoA ligase